MTAVRIASLAAIAAGSAAAVILGGSLLREPEASAPATSPLRLKAPVVDLAGRPVTLSDYQGRVVMLNFFSGT